MQNVHRVFTDGGGRVEIVYNIFNYLLHTNVFIEKGPDVDEI